MSSYWELIHQVESYIKEGTISESVPPMASAGGKQSVPLTQDSMEALAHYVHQCTKCDIADSKHIVFGKGDLPVDIVVVGPPPSTGDAREPFSKAGYHHLAQWLRAIGIDIKERTYLTSAVKCPHDDGVIPTTKVMQNCLPYLWHQITLAKPKGILITGKLAGQIFLSKTLSVDEMRGEVYTYEHIPVVVTYHPVEVLRNPQLKRPVWEDLQRLQKAMGV